MKDRTITVRVIPFVIGVIISSMCVVVIHISSLLMYSTDTSSSMCSSRSSTTTIANNNSNDGGRPYPSTKLLADSEYFPQYDLDRKVSYSEWSSPYTRTNDTIMQQSPSSFLLSYPPGRKYHVPGIQPKLGQHHRSSQDAIFCVVKDYYASSLNDVLITFLGTLLETGFKGDIVLGVDHRGWDHLSSELTSYFEKVNQMDDNPRIIMYEIKGCQNKRKSQDSEGTEKLFATDCNMENLYLDPITKQPVIDLSGRRRNIKQIQYEYYWIWAQQYSDEASRIILIDYPQNVYFQANPFDYLPTASSSKEIQGTLFTFEESRKKTLGESKIHSEWIQTLYTETMLQRLTRQYISGSGVVAGGGETVIEQYALLMLFDIDNVHGIPRGNDEGNDGHHNVLLYTGQFEARDGIDRVLLEQNREHLVFYVDDDTDIAAYKDSTTGLLLNRGGKPCPIVVDYNRQKELGEQMQRKLAEFKQTMQK